MAERVLITGARAAAALDIARDFLAAGWEVHLADCVRSRLGRWSNLPLHHHAYPAPRSAPEGFREHMVELAQEHGIDLVVPTCEEVFHLASPSLHALLGERLFAPGIKALRTLHDKLAFAQNCQEHGLTAPESLAVDDRHTVTQLVQNSVEWVFKPRFSRFGESTLIAPQPRDLANLTPTPQTPWMAQRLIAGEEVCFHAVAHRGKLVAFAAYRSDWRLGGGARYAFEPVGRGQAEQLRAIAETLAERVVIQGQFACDVIFDAGGMPHLIECNPRATSGVHLLTGDGDLARAMAGGIEVPETADRSAYLAPAMWIFGLPLALRMDRLREWRRLRARSRDAISRPGDRLPAAGSLADAAVFFLKGLRHGISTNAATTFDIEWNGEELD